MQHVTLVTTNLDLAINVSQTFNEHEFFLDTVDDLNNLDHKISQKQSQGIFWDLQSFPLQKFQPQLVQLRAEQHLPIILVAKNKHDLAAAFSHGFDDYITAPFYFPEFFLRFTHHQQNYQKLGITPAQQKEKKHPRIIIDDVVIDRQKYKAFRNHKDLGLTPKELKLLIYLIEHSPNVLNRQQLLEGVWGDIYDISQTSRMVDIHISHLRDKIEVDPKNPQRIQTVRGFGYHFVGDYQKEE